MLANTFYVLHFTSHALPRWIPPIAFLLRELGFRRAAGFFQQQHFEIEEAG